MYSDDDVLLLDEWFLSVLRSWVCKGTRCARFARNSVVRYVCVMFWVVGGH